VKIFDLDQGFKLQILFLIEQMCGSRLQTEGIDLTEHRCCPVLIFCLLIMITNCERGVTQETRSSLCDKSSMTPSKMGGEDK